MSVRRADYLATFIHLFSHDVVQLRSERVDDGPIGWPAMVIVHLPSGDALAVDLYLGNIHSHSRGAHEMRFQGPAKPDRRTIIDRNRAVPILVGIDLNDDSHTLVAGNARKYVGSPGRQTVLFNVQTIEIARSLGWSEYHSKSGEVIRGFRPEHFPIFVDMARQDLEIPEADIHRTIADAGVPGGADDETRERVIHAFARLLRDYRFRKDVVVAYEGRCALSDLNWEVVQAAHILPVAAPGSNDHVSNGIGLTPTFHSLFDKHLIYVSPVEFRVQLHPRLWTDRTDAAQRFLNSTRSTLRKPRNPSQFPDPQMLIRRYQYFGDAYSWATDLQDPS